MKISPQQQSLLYKLFSLFSVVRGYNLAVIVLAQLLSAVFIFAPEFAPMQTLSQTTLWLLVFASVACVAAGYIINNFFDTEKDLINRPQKTLLEQHISPTTKLGVYFVLNTLMAVMAFWVSVRAALFFVFYALLIALYSYKIERMLFLRNLLSAFLAIAPFLAIALYFRNFSALVLVFASYLFLMIFIRELVKDLENLQGDLTLNYKTLPVVYGRVPTQLFISFLTLVLLGNLWVLLQRFDLGVMQYYFWISLPVWLLFLGLLWKATQKKHYLSLHILLKGLILCGIVSIVLLKV
ncbi:MAG: geranylgeranylglycerol-phosphate geranylgeranyltransferase [Flavobacteriaceae bacterium]|nr:geranylgeranylglycerol-phosphate geranylgeranyltransferase [Flavobacteriaceae bacterium]MDG2315242.1 geranylgeranylglycerol-phosphate geranylgeranyltransferase [Flavobacteriaceae bacterium]